MLIIPDANDSDKDIGDLVDFVASVSETIPLHFSAYHPDHKLTHPPTPFETMLRAREIGMKSLNYVYLGNVNLAEGSDTLCPGCGDLLVKRDRFFASVQSLAGSRCSRCNFDTGIVQ